MSTPEAAVKKLARLEGNMTCPNCGTYKKFGFSTVCIKFLTFVCNDCKASHAAYSHRCKSLTMSTWSPEEVLKLKNAGNDVARRTWLANAPPVGVGKRPKEGDDINKFKAFIVDVYERKMYYSEDSGGGGGAVARGGSIQAVQTAVPLSGPVPTPTSRARQPRRVVPAPAPPPTPAPAPPPVADLLDFSAAPAPSVQAPSNNDFASFDAFSSQPSQVAAEAPAPTPIFDPFNSNNSSIGGMGTNNTAAPSSLTPPPAPTPAPTTTSTTTKSVDPFAGMTSFGGTDNSNANNTATTPSNTAAFGNNTIVGGGGGGSKQPVMNAGGASFNSNVISGMNTMAAMQQQQQMNTQMMMRGGGGGGGMMGFGGMGGGGMNPQMQQGNNNNTMGMGYNKNMMGGMMNPMGAGMMQGNNNMSMGMMGMTGNNQMQGGMNNNNMMMGGGGGGMMFNNNMTMNTATPMSMTGGSNNLISSNFGNKPSSMQQKPKHDPFSDLKF